MIKHVDSTSISNILSDPKTYVVPKYQREYTWGKTQWSQLFDDVTENDLGYFLGSIICVNGLNNPYENEVIDGQQRLTTLTILLLAIYSKLKEMKSEFVDDDDLLTDYNNIRREFFKNDKNNNKKVYIPRIRLQVQNSNKDDFESLLREQNINIGVGEKPKWCGLRGIYKAFNYFSKCIDDYVEREQLDKVDALFDLAEKFNSAVLVVIEVDSHKDAYMLFESLNNRGIPLSSIDLIKNILIRESEIDDATDSTYENWKLIVNTYLGDNYNTQERFFRQYYNAFRDRLNAPYQNSTKKYELGYIATKNTMLEIYEKLIHDQGYKKFIKDITDASKLYSIIINNSNEEKVYSKELLSLERIQGAPSYLLILYIMDQQKVLQISDDTIKQVVTLLMKFFVRRNITDYPNTRDLQKIFMDIVSKIREDVTGNVYEIIYNELVKNSSTNEIFETKLRGPLYAENDMATRFILCSIEEQYQTKEIYTNFWERDKSNKFKWTIEHIFPEGNNIPEAWINMIANGDRSLAQEYQSKYVHTLGNLTLTGYNPNLSNLSFDKKMNRTSKDGKEIGYKNGLHLNEDVVSQFEWTVEIINNRTNKLVDICLKLFSL